MHPSYAAVRALGLAVALALSGCTSPTDAAGDPSRLLPPGSTFDVTLVVRESLPAYWLQPGDSISVRLSLDGGAREPGRSEGSVAYEGIPIWAPAPVPSGAFESSYFTHPDLGETLVSLFWGGSINGQRLILFIDPESLGVAWAITVTDSAGQLIDVASGEGR